MLSALREHVSLFGMVGCAAVFVFSIFWLAFWGTYYFSARRGCFFYFDPQDTVAANRDNRALPLSAETATFEPMLKHYIGVTQLLVTVAAASIAFGGSSQSLGGPIVIAKLLLAWSIFYGVLFCALLIWRYDEYARTTVTLTPDLKRKSIRLPAQYYSGLRKHADACGFFIHAYCVMPDHMHMPATAASDESSAIKFLESFKQETGFEFAQRAHRRLWIFRFRR